MGVETVALLSTMDGIKFVALLSIMGVAVVETLVFDVVISDCTGQLP